MIKKRNLDPSLVQWIMTETGLGPGLGDIKYLVPAASSTSQYRTWLQGMGVSDGDMYTSLADAYAALTADRNDVLLAMPGSYTQTARLAWAKDHTHMIGLGGPNNLGDHSLSGVTIYTSTTNLAETIDITGDRCMFQNLLIGNGGDHAGSLTAVNVDGWGCHFKNVSFLGVIADTQVSTEACCSLSIDRLGHFPIFEDCVIGQNNWNVRTQANQGMLRFIGTSAPAPQNGIFRRCRFLSRSETSTVAMVALPANTCIERGWEFDDCVFMNFSINNVNTLASVFYDNCGSTYNVLLKRCSAVGIDEWQTADKVDEYITSDMPIVGLGGGLARTPTAPVGT